MFKLLQKIYQPIQDWIIENVDCSYGFHFIGGSVIMKLMVMFTCLPIWAEISIITAIAIFKEIYDFYSYGGVDIYDIIFTIFGGLIAM